MTDQEKLDLVFRVVEEARLDEIEWNCPECGEVYFQELGSLPESGTSVCPDCDVDCAGPTLLRLCRFLVGMLDDDGMLSAEAQASLRALAKQDAIDEGQSDA